MSDLFRTVNRELGVPPEPAPPDPDEPAAEISAAAARDIHKTTTDLLRSRVKRKIGLTIALGVVWWGVDSREADPLFWFVGALMAFSAAGNVIRWRRLRRADPLAHVQGERQGRIEQARITRHLAKRSNPMTWVLLGAITAVSALEIYVGFPRALELTGLVKPAAKAGEWWRLLSATYMHAHPLHFSMNVSALGALAPIIEAYDRRWRVPLVYLCSALVGSLASTWLVTKPSVGASGGITGLLGYLIVAAGHPASEVPRSLRSGFIGGVLATGAIGVAGFFIIDNAAHAGGALTGAALGWWLLSRRPSAGLASGWRGDDIAGCIAAVVLVAGAVWTIVKMLG